MPALISTLLAEAKSSQAPLRLVSLLGVAVDVMIRLKTVKDEPPARLTPDLKVCSRIRYSKAVLTWWQERSHGLVYKCRSNVQNIRTNLCFGMPGQHSDIVPLY